MYFMLNILPKSTKRPELYPVTDVCDLLRGSISSQQQQQQCKKRSCLNVIPDAYVGKWRKRNTLTKEDIDYRKKMDVEIRLKMRVQFPADLVRNDSRYELVVSWCCSYFTVYHFYMALKCSFFGWMFTKLQYWQYIQDQLIKIECNWKLLDLGFMLIYILLLLCQVTWSTDRRRTDFNYS